MFLILHSADSFPGTLLSGELCCQHWMLLNVPLRKYSKVLKCGGMVLALRSAFTCPVLAQ